MFNMKPVDWSPAILIPLLLVLAGCATTKEQDEAAIAELTAQQVTFTPESWAASADGTQLDNARQVDWLSSFNDSQLSALVKEALDNNLDLAAAGANLERANALAEQAGAQLKPQVNLAYAPSRSGSAETSRLDVSGQTLGLQLAWEADIWGRISAGQRAAVASAEAAAADYKFAQHSLAASATKAYFIAIETGQQEAILKDILESLDKTIQIVEVQYKNGLVSAQDVALAKSDQATSREQLITLQASKREALRALEVLLGRYPEADIPISSSLPEIPPMPPAGLPSDVLERRPDIIAAERRVAAAYNALNQAKAAKLPSLSLTGNVVGASTSLSNITDPANVTWQLAGNLLAPLFDGGAREAQVEVSTAEQKQALASYTQTVLTAFTEVENNLDLAGSLVLREKELSQALAQAQKAYKIASLRYNEGEIALIDLLSIQQRVLSSRSALSSLHRISLEQRVNLYLALGGDWGHSN